MHVKKSYGAVVVLLAAVLVAGFLAAESKSNRMERYEVKFFDSFDTVTVITGYAKSQEEFQEQTELLQKKLKYYHELFDIYHAYEGINNIKTVNDAAGKEPVEVDREMIGLLKLGKEMYQETGGKINIAYGSVLSVWHEYREQGMADPKEAQLPPEELLRKQSEHTDISKVIIDEKASTVFLQDEDMSLDVGSIGKGYAVQRLAEYAEEIGMKHLLISVGGNVCAVGNKGDGEPWRVGIENPDLDSDQSYVGAVELTEGSIVTSGNYQRFYMVEGKRYCHIIDPDTGMPSEYFPSVSVMAEDSGKADALSTSLFNMEVQEGLALVESMPGVEALWIMEDGGVRCSSGFEFDEEK
ncbi:MAG: FAD:protein FMN transferase [Lachnospiraceae bacterium]|nr:FAD:protein FMN transferase [Lachnospiraceae bacterium]